MFKCFHVSLHAEGSLSHVSKKWVFASPRMLLYLSHAASRSPDPGGY